MLSALAFFFMTLGAAGFALGYWQRTHQLQELRKELQTKEQQVVALSDGVLAREGVISLTTAPNLPVHLEGDLEEAKKDLTRYRRLAEELCEKSAEESARYTEHLAVIQKRDTSIREDMMRTQLAVEVKKGEYLELVAKTKQKQQEFDCLALEMDALIAGNERAVATARRLASMPVVADNPFALNGRSCAECKYQATSTSGSYICKAAPGNSGGFQKCSNVREALADPNHCPMFHKARRRVSR